MSGQISKASISKPKSLRANMPLPAEIPVARSSSGSATKNSKPQRISIPIPPARESPRDSLEPKPSSATENAVWEICESCELPNIVIWNCSYCDMNFCDPCWVMQGPHKAGRSGPDGLPHEKADPDIVKRLKSILSPPAEVPEQYPLHINDDDTTWFGVARDSGNRPIFQDYGRYATIMADSNQGEHLLRYPELVSFIGQTGAGKSTIVKMLIDQQERLLRSHHKTFPSPVVGSIQNEHTPTSGDVHLYSDPRTYFSDYPLLYADCEGLEGGETLPISVQIRESATSGENGDPFNTKHEYRKRERRSRITRGYQHSIRWADSPEKSKRQYAVTELYPRLLYTFSDVIVFVLRNTKTFESAVLSKLVSWASASMEKSLNQPTLPHAVIVLNATDTEINQKEWDPENATNSLLSTVADVVHRDSSYQHLIESWSRRGKTIHTMKDLLECYYSSVTVVRIPVKGRYMKIDNQIKKLRNVLHVKCVESSRAKRRSRMLSNSEEMNMYLQCAFDHFTHDLITPFNFMDTAFKMNPIPLDFGGNILKLAVAMKNSRYTDPRNIFRELSFMIASCILLDCSRQNLKGPAEQILEKAYMNYCNMALNDFCAIFCPCTFSSKNGRCVNVQERHAKGHQNDRGQIIGTGPYESDFTWENFAEDWRQLLQSHLSDFQNKVQTVMVITLVNELEAITDLHAHNVTTFYDRLGGASKFFSHTTCFCCLREMAEHPLPCGHVLCSACVKFYGQQHPGMGSVFILRSCPLHETDTVFPTPWNVFFKPPLSGVRILSLDGGGIRGIVILEVLHAVEKELDGKIPIQNFFDLIVGTSTGGLLALGLGVKDWSVDHLITLFPQLIDKAFTPKVSGLKFGKRKYRTKPLEEVLVDRFKDDPIFGGIHETPSRHSRKVAVTAATETGDEAVIFTNYNRPDIDEIGYRMIRPDNPNEELRIWEAARATSAAPTFFRPFVNARTKEGYLDGAVFYNNPVRIANYESKLIWPDIEDCHPDILLSIGTGHNGSDTIGSLNTSSATYNRVRERKVLTKQDPSLRRQRSVPALLAFPEVQSWLNILFRRVDNILDSELIWRNFRKDIAGMSSRTVAQRYVRVNPQIGFRTPKMDEKNQVHRLHDDVKSRMGSHSMKIVLIAYRLVASSFYFEKTAPMKATDDHYKVQGKLNCRFAPGSDHLRALGEYLRKHQLEYFQPFFRIQEVNEDEPACSQDISISPKVIQRMIEFGVFELGSIVVPVSVHWDIISIDLHLSSDPTRPYPMAGFPISGFPRTLGDGDTLRRASVLLSSSPSSATPPSDATERPKMVPRPTLHQQSNARNFYSGDDLSNISGGRDSDSYNRPETSNAVEGWTQRRHKMKRLPPKPVPDYIGRLLFERKSETGLAEDEDELGISEALERAAASSEQLEVESAVEPLNGENPRMFV